MTARPTRRDVLIGSAGVVAGAGAGAAGLAWVTARPDAAEPAAAPPGTDAAAVATGPTQAGIDRPGTPQPHGLITVLDLPERFDLDFLPRLGVRIRELTDPRGSLAGLPDGPGSLTVTIGLGPRIVGRASPDAPDAPGATDLPDFDGDAAIDPSARGGDLLIAAYGDRPTDLRWVTEELTALVPHAQHAWSQAAFRSPGTGMVTRNPLGFLDGVIVPRGEAALQENVWLDGDLAGATICVIRRLRLDVSRFRARPVAEQEQVIGRRQDTGAPLTGGDPMAEADLHAKTPQGEFVLPVHSHVRAAHPSFTGSRLMLRRGYGFDNGVTADGRPDSGLLFVCFQQDLRTFVATQRRLDEVDDLMAFVTPTASATFLILPGFDDTRPLGSTLLP